MLTFLSHITIHSAYSMFSNCRNTTCNHPYVHLAHWKLLTCINHNLLQKNQRKYNLYPAKIYSLNYQHLQACKDYQKYEQSRTQQNDSETIRQQRETKEWSERWLWHALRNKKAADKTQDRLKKWSVWSVSILHSFWKGRQEGCFLRLLGIHIYSIFTFPFLYLL